jgi:hypothetical protein
MARRAGPERPAPGAPAAHRRPWWLIALGLAATIAFAIATLPASLARSALQRAGIEAASYAGSVWNGRAVGLVWRGAALGDLGWRISPWPLLRGRVGGELSLRRANGRLQTRFEAGTGGRLRLESTEFDLPVEAVSALPVGLPPGWRGRVSGRLDELQVAGGWPTVLRGTLDMDALVAPPPRNTSIGSYRIVIPDAGAAVAPGELTAQVNDKDGPFSFAGRFTLAADRSFLLEGTLAPRGTTPPALARSLALLGPADAAGRRPVSVSGTL